MARRRSPASSHGWRSGRLFTRIAPMRTMGDSVGTGESVTHPHLCYSSSIRKDWYAEGSMATRYLFVDGGYLRKVTHQFAEEFFGRDVTIPIDYARLGQGFRKCFYYDCVPPRRREEGEAEYGARVASQRAQFSSIRMLDDWHVTEGVMVGQGANARQKQVDIQIAVDMLSHSHRRNMDELDFIAGDQDFRPLLETLVRDGMYVRLIYELRSASEALIEAADAKRKITIYDMVSWSNDAFSRSRPLPVKVSHSGVVVRPPGSVLIENGTAPVGHVELWASSHVFTIEHADRLNPGNVMLWAHADRAFLKKVFANVGGETRWTPIPGAESSLR